MRRLKKWIKKFDLVEEYRARITLGTGVRLDPKGNYVELVAPFSTAPDLYVKTWVTNPKCVKQWVGFECEGATHTVNNVVVDALQFRLSDGTTELFWDGAAWSAAGASDWNTEEDIATNISTFPVTSQSLGVIINLSTTNASYSPRVYAVKVLYESDIETLEDLIFRSLIPELRSSLQPIAEVVAKSDGTDKVVLTLESTYDITGIDSVYNLTNDQNKLVDLFGSYNPTTKTITLSAAQTLGDTLLIRFVYSVEVGVTTSRDYTELAKVPALVIEDYKSVRTTRIGEHESVINKATGDGWQMQEGAQYDLDLPLLIVAAKEKDATRIGEEVRRFFGEHTIYRLRGTDEDVGLIFIEEVNPQTYPSPIGLHTARAKGRIKDALFYNKPAMAVKATLQFRPTFSSA